MRISDWSSDMCSSELLAAELDVAGDRTGHVLHWRHPAQQLLDAQLQRRVVGAQVGGLVGALEERLQATADTVPVDRKSVVYGKRLSVRGALGGRRNIHKTQHPSIPLIPMLTKA